MPKQSPLEAHRESIIKTAMFSLDQLAEEMVKNNMYPDDHEMDEIVRSFMDLGDPRIVEKLNTMREIVIYLGAISVIERIRYTLMPRYP